MQMSATATRVISPWRSEQQQPARGNGMALAAYTDHLAQRFAHTITGPYKQDISMLLQGPKGSGKSYASLRIAYNTARLVAEILDGDGGEWPKYFSMDNVAIIDPERASEIIGNAKPHNIYIFDDIGVGWNSRAFASKENRDKNDIFQINRVSQTVQILSMPNQFLLDKVPRMLCNYMAEMDRGVYGQGISLMKAFKTKTLFRLGNQQITPHLVAADGEKIVKYVIHRPPKFLAKEYDQLRREVTRRIIAARANQGEEDEEEGSLPGKKPSLKTKQMYAAAKKLIPTYEQYRLQGLSHREALKDAGISPSRWRYWRDEGVLEWHGLKEY